MSGGLMSGGQMSGGRLSGELNSYDRNSHINKMTMKAEKARSFLQRNIHACPRTVRAQAYTTYPRVRFPGLRPAYSPEHQEDRGSTEEVGTFHQSRQ